MNSLSPARFLFSFFYFHVFCFLLFLCLFVCFQNIPVQSQATSRLAAFSFVHRVPVLCSSKAFCVINLLLLCLFHCSIPDEKSSQNLTKVTKKYRISLWSLNIMRNDYYFKVDLKQREKVIIFYFSIGSAHGVLI